MKSAFVTVGTTRFDELVNRVVDEQVLATFKKLDIGKIVMQIGRSEWDPVAQAHFGHCKDEPVVLELHGVEVSVFRFRRDIQECIKASDVVIGHAGAGTALEVLRAGKPLIAVVNGKLMDNHQNELAEKLAELGHILYCTPDQLPATLINPKLFSLAAYNSPPFAHIAKYLDRRLNVVS
ncbi:unnamed protein product, partial [Mesorhabditis spiculigera]